MFSRALIVLLVILNLGVAAWWLLRAEPAAPRQPQHPAGVPRLQLLSEAPAPRPAAEPAPAPSPITTTPPADTAPVATTAAPVADIAAPARCFSFGPFADAAGASAALAKLPAGTRGLRTRSEPARRGAAWTVLMPPQADRAAAQALAQRIDAAGFKDYYVIATGTSANGIALGRFGSEQAARQHQSALQAAGFQAQLQPPATSGAAWLDVEAASGTDAQALRAALGAARVAPRDCAA